MTSNKAVSPPIAAERPFQFRLVHLLGGMVIVAAVLAIVVLIRSARHRALEATCEGKLSQIALALQIYHDTYRQFPPAYHVDATGKRTHSWRFLILPFAESIKQYPYTIQEPWTGPTNSKLHSIDNRLYRCPADQTSPPGMTNYVAIVGKGTMWPGVKSTDMADLKDGSSKTLMVVEISHSDIHWMEPRDLPVEDLAAWLDPAHKPRLLGNHIEGGLVAFADGSVEFLSRDVTMQRLRAMISPAGKD